jgi:VWFA-related protein
VANARRTLAVLVDDLGLSFASIARIRSALNKFVDEDIEAGDLVAIIQSSKGMGALQQFTTDKRLLHVAIGHIRFNGLGRVGVSSFAPLGSGGAGGGLNAERNSIITAGSLAAVNWVVAGLRDVPGRKTLILFTENLQLFHRNNPDPRVMDQIDRLVDAANRSSTVIDSVDPRGLDTYQLTAADDTRGMNPRRISRVPMERAAAAFRSQEGMSLLAEETGGLFLSNTNDIGGALHKLMEDASGYYLLGYHPDASTFDPKTNQPRFHHLKVRVKVAGLHIRSRAGFIGTSDEMQPQGPRTTKEQMARALFSPFGASAIHVRLTALFTNSAAAGSYLNAMLFIDPKDLRFHEEPDGWHKATVEVVAVTCGEDGQAVDSSSRSFNISAKGGTFDKMLRDGMVYKFSHPVKKPGYYQMRVAIRDDGDEQIGSANQFVEVPDVTKGLTLSSILMTQMRPEETAKLEASPTPAAAATGEGQVATSDPKATPAVRIFKPGEVIEYGYQILNAEGEDGKPPDIEVISRIFRDGAQVNKDNPMPFQAAAGADPKHLVAAGAFRLGALAPAGDYMLQVIVTEKKGEKKRVASQSMDFEVEK